MKILVVFGTRPEAIKMAPLIKELRKSPEKYDTRICVTGQHREMLDQVLKIFEIQPNYDLNLMKSGQDLYDLSARVLLGIRSVLEDFVPDWVLVHGDTTTSTMVALGAYYKKIKVAHVESGLRTSDIYSPWPEEMNRRITTRISSMHFAPTYLSQQNLLNEGVNKNTIFITGNTVIDALNITVKNISTNKQLRDSIKSKISIQLKNPNLISEIESGEKKLILVTGHRRENFGISFENICDGLLKIAKSHINSAIIYPVHMNPNVKEVVESRLAGENGIDLISPLDYQEFVWLMNQSYLILTDSGGIQEEAPGLGIPVLVMRSNTERPEGIEAGTVRLIGTNSESIYNNVTELMNDEAKYTEMSTASNPYGDGKTSEKIIRILNSLD